MASTIAMPPALSLPTTHFSPFPDRNLTLASSVADAAPPPSLAVAAARSVAEQIEAAEKIRRDALYLLARRIEPGSSESSPPSVSSPPPAAAIELARRRLRPPYSAPTDRKSVV